MLKINQSFSFDCSRPYTFSLLIVLGFNNTSTLGGHFVSCPWEREKRDRRDSRGDEREGQRSKRKMTESEETEETSKFREFMSPAY